MDKFKGYMLCSDIDGTLVADGKVSKENIEAIRYFQKEGGIFTIASGRIPCSIQRFFDGFYPNAPIISHNGAAIYDCKEGRYIKSVPMSCDILPVLRQIESLCPFAGIEVYMADNSPRIAKMNDTVKWHVEWEKLKDVCYEVIYKSYEEILPPWIKVVFVQTKEETAILREKVEKMGIQDRFTLMQSGSVFYEILPKEANKGKALLYVADKMGIMPDKIIAVGDNENDIDMICTAGCGVAVGNANEKLKSVADIITVSHTESAIAKIIKKLDKNLLTKWEKSGSINKLPQEK